MNSILREKLRAGRPCFGTWLSLGSPIVAELCAEIGFDWLLLDLEHGCATEASILPCLQAIRKSGVAGVVRVGSADAAFIARLLDWGADGIMAPHISTPEQAVSCAAAMRFPPRGIRGFSRSAREFGYGLHPPPRPQEADPPILLAQIEDWAGVCRASAIAGVEGVDALFVGPSDLRLDLSVREEVGADRFEEALTTVLEAARAGGKAAGILLRDVSALAETVRRGFRCVAVDSEMAILRRGYEHLKEAISRIG